MSLAWASAPSLSASTTPDETVRMLISRGGYLLPTRLAERRFGRFGGQRKLSVTADTYTHVLTDGREVDYAPVVTLDEVRCMHRCIDETSIGGIPDTPLNHALSAWLRWCSWARLDSNQGPRDYESPALTS